MIANVNPIFAAAIFGLVLIIVRFWRTILYLLVKKYFTKQEGEPVLTKSATPTPKEQLFDRIIEYLLTITVTFISFYAAYLLSIKKTADDQKQAAIELLQQAEVRCSSLKGLLKTYTTNSLKGKSFTPSDSEVVTNYCNNSMAQPLYITDAISIEKILSYLSPKGFEVLSGLEESQKVAHNNIIDTTLSYLHRHIAFIAFMRFEYLRDTLIRSEREYFQGKIKSKRLDSVQDYVNQKNTALANAVNPRVYSQLTLDTTANRDNFTPEEPDTDIIRAPEIDSLWRYCYLMDGPYNHKKFEITANCFFFRKNKNLYLVSTYGSMTSWNPWDTSATGYQAMPFPDTFYIRLFSKSTHACTYIPIDISKIKKESKRIRGYSEPDVYFLKIVDTTIETKYEINTINKFLAFDRSKYQKPYQVIIVGSPMSAFKRPQDYCQAQAEINFSDVMGPYELNLFYRGIGHADSVNYDISSPMDDTYWGSPIFFKELMPEVDRFRQILIFGGIYTGPQVNKTAGMAVRPEQIIRRLAALK